MAADLGVKFEPVEVTWGTAIAALQGNKIDMMSMMDATPERAQAVDFPKTPLLYYSLAVLARDDLPVKAWADLDKPSVRIAVPQASSMDKFLTENVGQGADLALPRQRRGDRRLPGRARRRGVPVPPAAARGAPAARRRQDRRADAGAVAGVERRGAQGSRQVLRRAWVDKEIAKFYASGQTQKWYEEFLVGFGLDPKASPPVMKEMLGKS